MGVKVEDKISEEITSTDNGIYTKSWSSTNVSNTKSKTRRAKPEPIIIYDIFDKCEKLVEDQTWKNIFKESSYGYLPKGFNYKDGFITHKIRNKVSRIEISQIPEIAVNEIIEFFKDKAGIISQDDHKKSKEEYENFIIKNASLYPNKWSEIRRKKIKDVLISSYITKLSKELNLDRKAKDDLRNKIYLGFILGCFTNDQIELQEGYISNILGLEYDKKNNKFLINYQKAPKQSKKSRSSDKVIKSRTSFYTLWIKFLETIDKRVTKASNKENYSSREDQEISSIIDE